MQITIEFETWRGLHARLVQMAGELNEAFNKPAAKEYQPVKIGEDSPLGEPSPAAIQRAEEPSPPAPSTSAPVAASHSEISDEVLRAAAHKASAVDKPAVKAIIAEYATAVSAVPQEKRHELIERLRVIAA